MRTPALLPHIKSGKLRAVGNVGSVRTASMPDLPNIGETVPGFALDSWFGIMGPAGMPKPIVERVTNLMTLLLSARQPITSAEIRNELAAFYPKGEVALRGAIERDKKLLREIGVPIESTVLGGNDAGKTAYWIDRRRYELADLDLAADERAALELAVAAALHMQGVGPVDEHEDRLQQVIAVRPLADDVQEEIELGRRGEVMECLHRSPPGVRAA